MKVMGHKIKIIKYGTSKHVYIDDKFDSMYPDSFSDLLIIGDIRSILIQKKQGAK